MKRQVATLVLVMLAAPVLAAGSHSKRAHIRKDGTYVAPSQATNPNSTKLDNYSTKGNVNLYTGKQGSVDPYAPKRTKGKK